MGFEKAERKKGPGPAQMLILVVRGNEHVCRLAQEPQKHTTSPSCPTRQPIIAKYQTGMLQTQAASFIEEYLAGVSAIQLVQCYTTRC